jgi:hypothetical protein
MLIQVDGRLTTYSGQPVLPESVSRVRWKWDTAALIPRTRFRRA